MTGSLHVKNDKFYMVVNVYENGVRKQKWISTGLPVKGNKKKAEKLLAEKLLELEALGDNMPVSDMQFSEAIKYWLGVVKMKVDEVTYHGYEDIAQTHVIPYFTELNVRLCDLKKRDVQTYINKKASNGRVDGKGGLSASSLRLHKNILYQTCKYAMSEELITLNPCEGVTLPPRTRVNYHYYSAAQINQLLEKAKDDVLFPVIKMTAIYGLRRSEVLGLRWDAVDFEQGIITIKHTVTRVYKRVEKDKTKNKSSYRSFPMLPEIRDMLLNLKEKEKQGRIDFGKSYNENAYVFKWPDGTPFDPDYITHHFSSILKKYDMPHIRFHELRHSCASILIISGFTLKDVQEWLGHSSIDMTADIYSHLDLQRKISVGSKMMEAISA